MAKIFITNKIPEIGVKMLKDKVYQVHVNQNSANLTTSNLKQIVNQYDAILTMVTDKINEEILKSASPDLKIISNFAVGFDNIDVLTAKRHGIVVTNTPGVAAESVAEHTLLLILALSKKLFEADKYVRLGKFQKWDPMAFLSSQVCGKTIGIVGLGTIGTAVGKIAFNGFKMKILYYDIERFADFETITDAKLVTLKELLKESDFVTLHVPLTHLTSHLIEKHHLKMMKNSAILINTSRGSVVDEEALIWALKEKIIAGAGLDVYEHEPHIPHDLKVLDNVILTPHMASATYQTRENTAKLAAQNIIDVFEGKTPFGLVKVD